MATKKSSIKVAWKKLTDTAKIPQKAHNDDAGFDLYADENVVIKPHQTVLVKTGIAVQLTPPDGWNAYAKVEDTSGNALKKKIKTAGGVIDIGYDGNVGVVIRNNNLFKKIKVEKGAKIAQLIPYLIPVVENADWKDKETERGNKGYGETTGTV